MKHIHQFLVAIVLILLTLGVVMLASTSAVQGQQIHHDQLYFVKRQAVPLLVGLFAAIVMMRLDYHIWQKLALPVAFFTAILLIMSITPGVGLEVKGSSRWLRLGPVTIQPSEFGKFASIILLSWWMSRVQRRADEFKRGLLIPLLLLGFMMGLVFLEPDYGTTFLMGLVGFAVMYVGGSRAGYLVISGVIGVAVFVVAIMQNPERLGRCIAFWRPEKYAQDAAYQLLNAIYAFVMGGGGGVGLGESLQKQFYLPEAHTDFIFAILGEELGLGASIATVILFAGLFACGLRISVKAPDTFGRLLSFGLATMITLQAAINMGVVTGCLPTKGLPLPFISFGGTAMVVNLAMIGVLVNVALQSGDDETGRDRRNRL